MTEKKQRFTYYEEDLGDMILPNCLDNGKTVAKSVYECVDVLNALHEENNRLKKERNHFEKKKTEYLTEWNTCRIQNTELKNLIQEAYQTERTELGQSVLKQLLDSI